MADDVNIAQAATDADWDPVGTLDELKETGRDPSKFGSCSARTTWSKGCAHHSYCRFRKQRDGVDGMKGVFAVGLQVILSPQEGRAADGKIIRCHEFYGGGYNQRMRQSDQTGEIIRIVGTEYDEPSKTIKRRNSRRAHPTPVKGCLACASGTCYLREQYVEEVKISDFKVKRLTDQTDGYSLGNQLAKEMLAEIEGDTHAAAVVRNTANTGTPDEPAKLQRKQGG